MLTEIIESEEKSQRLESLKYLGLLAGSAPSIKKECIEILENVLISDDNEEIRCEAAKSLGKIPHEKALEPLKWVLKEKKIDIDLKIAVLRSIASIRLEGEEIKLFINELGNKNSRIRGIIKNQLIQIDPEILIKNLAKSLSDDKYSINHKMEIIRLIGYELSSFNISLEDTGYIKCMKR
jgi:HEAT repeat protein